MVKRVPRSKKQLLLSDVVDRYLRDVSVRGAPLTLVSYQHHLCVLVGLLADLCKVTALDKVEVDHLRQCVQHLLTEEVEVNPHRGRKPENGSTFAISTVRGHIRVWKAFFGWCFQEELIDVNPVTRLTAPKPTKKVKPTFTEEHIHKMLATCDTSTNLGFRDYVLLVLLLDTGMRLAEVAGLLVENVHENYVKVLGKGRKEREIGIYPETGKLLWKYINRYRDPLDEDEPVLFINRSRKPLTTSSVKDIVRRVRRESGLGDVKISPHVFRHTFAKMYLNNGGDLFKLSREMGHSDVQVTKLYLEDFGSSEARKDHNSYSPISRLNLKKRRGSKQK